VRNVEKQRNKDGPKHQTRVKKNLRPGLTMRGRKYLSLGGIQHRQSGPSTRPVQGGPKSWGQKDNFIKRNFEVQAGERNG